MGMLFLLLKEVCRQMFCGPELRYAGQKTDMRLFLGTEENMDLHGLNPRKQGAKAGSVKFGRGIA